MGWKKLSQNEIRQRIFNALSENVDYYTEEIIGIPASHLDNKVFYQDAPFLKDAPYLSTLIHNPNHIGCHTSGESESFFKGTQQIEKEVIEVCSREILKGEEEFDGYIASGGTEANMQAVWIYRNYFQYEKHAKLSEIALISTEDAHYSSAKAANVFQIDFFRVQVDKNTRRFTPQQLDECVSNARKAGKKYFIVVANMMTTMFGSVDDVELYTSYFNDNGIDFRLHVDGAYGGFFYPFSEEQHTLDFRNPNVNSITLDAHKMLQAPYGTGIFLIRKNWLQYATTKEASYVEGTDNTLIGSRSGANAIAIWMILMTYGPHGWYEKTLVLNHRTDWLCKALSEKGYDFYRFPKSNIVTIKSDQLTQRVIKKYGLVPDNHNYPKWHKIVVMDHVTLEKLEKFMEEL